ncbi:threonine synthase, partial [bacterium]|nr:threonine synthase [bacterium]
MAHYTGYKCSICNKEYLPASVLYTCPQCGGNLDVVIDFDHLGHKYQPEDITSRNDFSLWRYLPLLPIDDPGGEGTPLH